MRYRESCRARQSLRGIGCGEPEAKLALDFKTLDVAPLKRGLRHVSGSPHTSYSDVTYCPAQMQRQGVPQEGSRAGVCHIASGKPSFWTSVSRTSSG